MTLTSASKTAAKVFSVLTGLSLSAYLYLRTFVTFQCPNPDLLETFDPQQYLGVWYELRRANNIPFEDGECVTAKYTERDDGYIGVENTQWYGFFGGEDRYVQGQAEAWINSYVPGMLFVTFFFDIGGRYRILDTDYTSYVVVYSCDNALADSVLLSEYSWVLVRD